MRSLTRDARFVLRGLRRRPAFAITATLAVALGVGTTTAMFSVVDGVLLRPLPYADADRLVAVFRTYPEWRSNDMLRARWDQVPFSLEAVRTWRAAQTAFDDVGAWVPGAATVSGVAAPEQVRLVRATPSLLPLLGIRTSLGRSFLPGEDAPSAPRVALVTHEYWTTRLGGDSAALGRRLLLDEQPYELVGILPAGLNLTSIGDPAPIWINAGHHPSDLSANNNQYRVVGRLKSGITLERATAETELLVRGDTDPAKLGVRVAYWQHEQTKTARRPLLVLIGASGILLLIGCVNFALLLLGEATARAGEIAARIALGARRTRIVRMLVTESMILSTLGAVLGTAMAFAGTRALVMLAPRDVPRLAEVTVDLRVLGFALVAAVATGILCGLFPALSLSGTMPATVLYGSERSVSRRRGLAQWGLVASEVALGLVLLIGAGLLTRSLSRLSAVQPGFSAEGLLVMRVGLSRGRYGDSAAVHEFYRRAQERLSAIPGVAQASGGTSVPFTGSASSSTVGPEGRLGSGEARGIEARFGWAFPGYFETMGIPVLDGRGYETGDDGGAEAVVVNETMARRLWPNERAVGKRLRWGSDGRYTVVGVVGDVKDGDLAAEMQPTFYLSAVSDRRPTPILILRTVIDPRAIAATARRAIAEVAPDVPVVAAEPMTTIIARSTANQRFRTALISLFGVLAAALAAVGIYGVTARAVDGRMHEIGIRLALGSSHGAVMRLLVSNAMGAAAVGLAVGTLGAYAGGRVLAPYLFGVGSTDPVTYAGVAIALAVIGLIACWLPARRATRANPATVLRER
jgi:predicted permease